MEMRKTKLLMLIAAMGVTSAYADGDNYRGFDGFTFRLGMPVLKVSTNGTDYATIIGDTSETVVNTESSYHPGYNLGVGYQYGPGVEINLDWMSWHHNNSSSITSHDTILVGGQAFSGLPGRAESNVDWKLQSLDFTAGHRAMLSPNFSMYYYGGLNYTRVEKDMNIWGEDQDNFFHANVGTDFKGVGPEFGMEGTCYPMDSVPRFGVVGGTRIAFPYGTLRGFVREDFNEDLFQDNIPSEKTLVPTLGANVGIKYDFSLPQGKIGLQMGWQFTNYFNVTKASNYGSGAISASSQGPYFTLYGGL